VEKRTWDASRIYPGTTHEYWVYVPAQYTAAEPACVMVFQDGHDYVNVKGPVRVPTVFDNLIHKGEMPVTIGIFINPGKKEKAYDQRDIQYVALGDTYARFLLEEILPEVGKDYNLVDDAAGRAVAGMSDGGLASFTVGWERPDAFSKVISHIGSYTRLRGGSEYPYLIRKTRGKPKPIRVFLQDGANDINLMEGNWTLANLQMDSALMYARYDYRFELGPDGHDLRHGRRRAGRRVERDARQRRGGRDRGDCYQLRGWHPELRVRGPSIFEMARGQKEQRIERHVDHLAAG
jgi:enterochelin esterase family protein